MDNKINSKIAIDKLMILYIIKKSNDKITYNQLSNLILEYELLNYFTFVEYFNELKNTNFFLNDTTKELNLTDFSIQILDLMEDNINKDSKAIIDEIFNTKGLKDNYKNVQIISESENKLIVKLTIDEMIDEDFLLSFTLESPDDLKLIESNWKNKNKSLYRQILGILKS